jgi:hypothetical protein
MRAGPDLDGPGSVPPKLTFLQRVLVSLPHMKRTKDKQPIGDWMRRTFMKPEDPDSPKREPEVPGSVEEIQETVKRANDKERAIGLIAAPLAAGIGFLVVHALVVNDPPQHLKSGALNRLYVNPSLYDDVFLVLLILSLVMLGMAMWRKRLFLGIATALYGLAIFNLHYWGFGIPFVMVGAWYIVRAYRLQQQLRRATGDLPSGLGARRSRAHENGNSYSVRPGANKRYTPRSPSSSRAVRPKRAS